MKHLKNPKKINIIKEASQTGTGSIAPNEEIHKVGEYGKDLETPEVAKDILVKEPAVIEPKTTGPEPLNPGPALKGLVNKI